MIADMNKTIRNVDAVNSLSLIVEIGNIGFVIYLLVPYSSFLYP